MSLFPAHAVLELPNYHAAKTRVGWGTGNPLADRPYRGSHPSADSPPQGLASTQLEKGLRAPHLSLLDSRDAAGGESRRLWDAQGAGPGRIHASLSRTVTVAATKSGPSSRRPRRRGRRALSSAAFCKRRAGDASDIKPPTAACPHGQGGAPGATRASMLGLGAGIGLRGKPRAEKPQAEATIRETWTLVNMNLSAQ
jgi:hypothetical protein